MIHIHVQKRIDRIKTHILLCSSQPELDIAKHKNCTQTAVEEFERALSFLTAVEEISIDEINVFAQLGRDIEKMVRAANEPKLSPRWESIFAPFRYSATPQETRECLQKRAALKRLRRDEQIQRELQQKKGAAENEEPGAPETKPTPPPEQQKAEAKKLAKKKIRKKKAKKPANKVQPKPESPSEPKKKVVVKVHHYSTYVGRYNPLAPPPPKPLREQESSSSEDESSEQEPLRQRKKKVEVDLEAGKAFWDSFLGKKGT